MVAEEAMIKLRIDVDYAYPSRLKSFICTALNRKIFKSYLKNAKIIARMINESPEDVRATWFFTSKTLPDKEILNLLDRKEHEVALHIANRPIEEMLLLEKATKRKLRYYTTHGTARFLARIIWRRWKSNVTEIPKDFPLQSFYKFPTLGLDRLCYANNNLRAVRRARKSIAEGKVLHIHPSWLFQRGTINHRGPFYEALRRILRVDKEVEIIAVRKKPFFKVAWNTQEYIRDAIPEEDTIKKLEERGVDVFTFVERKWCNTIPDPPDSWVKALDNIALLEVTTYDEWWKKIGKKTRNRVRKAEKNGLKMEISEPDEVTAEGIWRIYNETPIRQGREFSHYGISLESVIKNIKFARDCIYVCAYFQENLVGFTQLLYHDDVARIAQILSLQRFWDKAINNAMIARTVDFCAKKKIRWIIYGRMGNHPSLDMFKHRNGFSRFSLIRYYLPITKKGQIATKLGLHKDLKDVLPQSVKYGLIPIYNWISRNKIRIKLHLGL